ncbi:hypothetical protein C8J56DRAFT_910843 [Mycena floridula]|nr:hypothetical protein C8J56DRAFT_910843 [Mycena floridula]
MATSSSTPAREEELMAIGKRCSHTSCYLVDFLPFQCQHCQDSFCQEHFKVTAHSCPKYDESKYNRVAPDCPFCQVPVAVRPGQDPNVRLEEHFDKECAVFGKKPKKSPVCANARCTKILFSPISCKSCGGQFCPTHRFPDDHSCKTVPAKSTPVTKPTLNAQAVKAGARLQQEMNSKASSAIDAIKKSVAPSPSNAAASSTRSTPATSANSSLSNPFSKTDRRAKAERESRRKAMQERAKKGLLSEEEKLILATEEAAKASEKSGDCSIM